MLSSNTDRIPYLKKLCTIIYDEVYIQINQTLDVIGWEDFTQVTVMVKEKELSKVNAQKKNY